MREKHCIMADKPWLKPTSEQAENQFKQDHTLSFVSTKSNFLQIDYYKNIFATINVSTIGDSFIDLVRFEID